MPRTNTSVLRPMDVLKSSIDKNVLVDVKGNRGYSGILEGYDIYMNLVIKNAGETIGGESRGVYEKLLVRGDNVIFVSPSKGDEK